MTTHSSVLAWKIPWTKKPGRLQSMVSQRAIHNWMTWYTHTFTLYSSHHVFKFSTIYFIICSLSCQGDKLTRIWTFTRVLFFIHSHHKWWVRCIFELWDELISAPTLLCCLFFTESNNLLYSSFSAMQDQAWDQVISSVFFFFFFNFNSSSVFFCLILKFSCWVVSTLISF